MTLSRRSVTLIDFWRGSLIDLWRGVTAAR
jgi:hypothetical protein